MQVSLLDNVSRLEGYLTHLKYKQPLPNKPDTDIYTVEILEL